MTLQELLNSEMDLASLAALARQGLAWWIDELTAMLPPAWRDRLSSRPRTWIEPRAAGGWGGWGGGRRWRARPRPGAPAQPPRRPPGPCRPRHRRPRLPPAPPLLNPLRLLR